MKFLAIGVSITILAGAAVWAQGARPVDRGAPVTAAGGGAGGQSVEDAVENGARWLASVQGSDGGWGQDGGAVSSNRADERLESTGNDVANTAVAALALLRAGPQYAPNVDRALDFILQRVESSPVEGLAITDRQGTQIQRKLGPYIDTFLTSMLLVQVDGRLPNGARNARVRRALEKTVAKIEDNQMADGSWNYAGGWAPVLGTSMASRSLFAARQQGVKVADSTLTRAETYTVSALDAVSATTPAATVEGPRGVTAVTQTALPVYAEAAGVALYQTAQALEQLSRTEEDRRAHADRIAGMQAQLGNARFVSGFGSMGGEEFFSYLNIGDSLKRTGGEAWTRWHADITSRILELQNADGTWAGHHCITGRVAMTSAAILNLTIDDED